MPVRRLLGWPDPGQVALSALIGILLAFYAARFLLPLLAPQAPRADADAGTVPTIRKAADIRIVI